MTQKLRFLSGRWTSTEVDLPTGEVLLVRHDAVDQVDAYRRRAALSAGALVIGLPESELPCAAALCVTATGTRIQHLDADACPQTTDAILNVPLPLGAIWVALADSADEWSDAVLGFTPDRPGDAALAPADRAPLVAPVPAEQGVAMPASFPPPQRASARRIGMYLGLSVLLGASVSAGAYAWTQRTPADTLIERIGARTGAEVLNSAQGPYYLVLPTDEQARLAARELRQVSSPKATVHVMSARGVAQQIGQQLDQRQIKYISLDVSRPGTPHVVLSAERGALDTEAQDALRDALLQALPYVSQVTFSEMSDQVLIEAAEQHLRQAGFEYSLRREPDRSVFTIHQLEAGRTLDSLERVIDQFQAKWGPAFVQFALDLQPEPLQDKSFVTGAQNYVLDRGQHWQFFTPGPTPPRVAGTSSPRPR